MKTFASISIASGGAFSALLTLESVEGQRSWVLPAGTLPVNPNNIFFFRNSGLQPILVDGDTITLQDQVPAASAADLFTLKYLV